MDGTEHSHIGKKPASLGFKTNGEGYGYRNTMPLQLCNDEDRWLWFL